MHTNKIDADGPEIQLDPPSQDDKVPAHAETIDHQSSAVRIKAEDLLTQPLHEVQGGITKRSTSDQAIPKPSEECLQAYGEFDKGRESKPETNRDLENVIEDSNPVGSQAEHTSQLIASSLAQSQFEFKSPAADPRNNFKSFDYMRKSEDPLKRSKQGEAYQV